MQEFKFIVEPEAKGMRLDRFIADFAKKNKLGLSREHIQKIISGGGVSCEKRASLKPNYRIKPQEEFTLRLEEKVESSILPEDIPLEVIYEDSDLAVINKPSGLVVHPGAGNNEHTLVNAILYRFKKLSDINPGRPGIVHRLDKDTSGLIVIAKNNLAHLALSQQFAKHSIKKKYVALVKGQTDFNEDVIELPIGRHPFKRKNMAVGFTDNTKYAKTFYKTIMRKKDASFLELEPLTGRTHQLRVHLSHIGHPILGDAKYGKNNDFSRLALHAVSIGFIHPRTGKNMEFSCSLPVEFKEFINNNS